MVGHKRERVLGRVGRAVNAAARDFAREAAQLENGGGREAAAERLVEQQVEVVALDKDRVVVETAMRLDVAVAGLVGEGLAGLPARLAAHVQAAGLLLGVAEGVGVANGGGRAATRGVANARRGGLEEGRPGCLGVLAQKCVWFLPMHIFCMGKNCCICCISHISWHLNAL